MKPHSLISPLTLLALIPSAIAATVQFCTGCEGPSLLTGHLPGINVTVHDENSTLLIFRSNDFAWGLEGSVDLDVIKPVDDNAYPICSYTEKDNWGLHYCDNKNNTGFFDQDTVLNDRIIWPVIATKLSPGESQNYTVPSAGAYCVVIRQGSADIVDLSGIDIHVSHSYGDFPLTVLLSLKVGVVAVLVLLFHVYLIPYAFPNTPLEHRYGFWKLLKLSLQGKLVVWLIHRFFLQPIGLICQDVDPAAVGAIFSPVQLSPWFLLDHILSLAFISAMYAVWNGLAGKWATGFYFFGFNEDVKRWEFDSIRTTSAYLTLLFVSWAGQILVHHVFESVSLMILFMNIDASLVAIIFSSAHHSKITMREIDADHCFECRSAARLGGSRPREPYYPAENEPDFTDVELETFKSSDERNRKGESFNERIMLVLGMITLYCLQDTSFFNDFCLILQIGWEPPYYINQYVTHMTYHHVIGLNLVANWLAGGVIYIWSQLSELFN